MQFVKFDIKNYKGIKECSISVERPGSRVFSLIGLNESGKTTILEAINYFVAADSDLQKLYDLESSTINKASFVPKSKKDNFNGDVTIAATVRLETSDLEAIDEQFRVKGWRLDYTNLPTLVKITQYFRFKDSNFVTSGRHWDTSLFAIKISGTKSTKVDATHDAWEAYHSTLKSRFPQICYFPTFLFELPDRIYIENIPNESDSNAYYRRLIQDILDSLQNDLTIEKHIVGRVKAAVAQEPWTWFNFLQTDHREQVNAVMLRASTKVTRVIMDSWKRVFNRDFDNKRIELEYGFDEQKSAIYIKMYLVDGAEKYDIGNRSLGFRWFFCFWLFTYFRTVRQGVSGVVFLLDEPASNLHARAQEELLANLESLSGTDNVVIYSTHSHYLINARWLDAAYIVANGALNYSGVEDEFFCLGRDEHLRYAIPFIRG